MSTPMGDLKSTMLTPTKDLIDSKRACKIEYVDSCRPLIDSDREFKVKYVSSSRVFY
jgi:hypothetical protein